MTVLTFGVATTISFTGSTAPFAAPALAGTLTGISSSICPFQFIHNRQSTHFFKIGIVTISAAPDSGGINATVAGSAGAGAVVGAISAVAGWIDFRLS
jgi:hypothetical protein